MIGVFDSGLGGLTVLRALAARFPHIQFLYLGDHANVPYGNRSATEIVELTRQSVEWLFRHGCRLVLLGCNTATSVAARHLQQNWLPGAGFPDHNVLGIVAPTVEAATQTPWAVTTPQYPQKYNTDLIFVFGTKVTITSSVFTQEIRKRCPKVRVVEQICSELAGAIEHDLPEARLDALVAEGVAEAVRKAEGAQPDRAILGCTHFPLVEDLFRRHLPASARLLSQPDVVADSLEDYLARHPEYVSAEDREARPILLTTGKPESISRHAKIFWPESGPFVSIGEYRSQLLTEGPANR
jgi:glutamate racemase